MCVRWRFKSSMIAKGSNEILCEPSKQIATSIEDYISSDLIKVTGLTGTSETEINCVFNFYVYFFHAFIIQFAKTISTPTHDKLKSR